MFSIIINSKHERFIGILIFASYNLNYDLLRANYQTADFIKSETGFQPEFGIILGTGLGTLIEDIQVEQEISYDQIPNFPVSTVESHKGKLIFGTLSDRKVIAMQGRFHFYEGYNMKEVTFPVRVMKLLGIKKLLSVMLPELLI